MRILVTSASFFEIRPLLEKLGYMNRKNEFVREYRLKNMSVDVMIPGPGIMATAFHLGRQLSEKNYYLAVNAGICGTYSMSSITGEVFEIIEESITDLGAEEPGGFRSIFDLGLLKPDSQPFSGGLLINHTRIRSKVLDKISKARGATVSSIPGRIRSQEGKLHPYLPDIESMEGAAFFYGCLLAEVPFTEIRAVSNFVEERDKSKWDLETAVKNLNRVLSDLILEQSETGLRV
jgi:futalosine hydrolase